MKFTNIILLTGVIAAGSLFAEVVVDDKLPAGNIIVLKASDDLPFGQAWNKGLNYSQGASAVMWFAREYKCLRLCRSFEVPFANANGAVVTPATCRDLGRDVVKVWKELLLK